MFNFSHYCVGSALYGEGNGNPLQYSCLANPMDGGAWWAVVHGVARSWTWLSNFPFTFHFHALEKEMATHSSVLAWRITGMGGLPSLGSDRVGHDWSDLAAAASTRRYISYLLYPFICWHTLRLFPYLGYCEYCCNEHGGTKIPSRWCFYCIQGQDALIKW